MRKWVVWGGVGILSLVIIFLAGWAASQTPMVPRSSAVWSRGKFVGHSPVRQPVALTTTTTPDGGVYLAWRNVAQQIELAYIEYDGTIRFSTPLALGSQNPFVPQIAVRPDGRLDIVWLENSLPQATVWCAQLTSDGDVWQAGRPISNPDVPVLSRPQLVVDRAGRRHILWADENGVQWVIRGAEGDGGNVTGEPIQVAAEGRAPMARAGVAASEDTLYLVWQEEKDSRLWEIRYAELDAVQGTVRRSGPIEQVFLRTGQSLGDVSIIPTVEWTYVFWWVQDFKYVSSQGTYAVFPAGKPEQRVVGLLPLRHGYDPIEISPLTFQAGDPHPVSTAVPVAMSATVPDPAAAGESYSQIIVATLDGQAVVDEQVVSGSVQASLRPTLAEDRDSHQHLVWLDTQEFGVYRVVYASTAPDVMANYNAWTFLDVLNQVFAQSFRLSTLLVSLIAALVMWAVLPLFFLVVYHLVTSEEILRTTSSWVGLAVAIGLEVLLCFVQPPRLGMDADWAGARWVIPAGSVVLAIIATAGFLRRRKYANLFGVYFFFSIINGLSQMLAYMLL